MLVSVKRSRRYFSPSWCIISFHNSILLSVDSETEFFNYNIFDIVPTSEIHLYLSLHLFMVSA